MYNLKEIKNIEYPENIHILIAKAEGVSISEENNDFIIIWDNYEDNDRFIQINKTYDVKESLFNFFNSQLDKQKIIEFCKSLPPILFMHLSKIYFVNQEEDIIVVDDESENNTFIFGRNLGMAVYNDSTIIIDVPKHLEAAQEDFQANMNDLGYSDVLDDIFYRAIYQTIAHELFHLAQFNPLIEDLITDGEDAAEEFCRQVI